MWFFFLVVFFLRATHSVFSPVDMEAHRRSLPLMTHVSPSSTSSPRCVARCCPEVVEARRGALCRCRLGPPLPDLGVQLRLRNRGPPTNQAVHRWSWLSGRGRARGGMARMRGIDASPPLPDANTARDQAAWKLCAGRPANDVVTYPMVRSDVSTRHWGGGVEAPYGRGGHAAPYFSIYLSLFF